MLDQCLKGVRVLDLSQYIPGPFATQLLGDLGAEVVKVEPPAGDPMRHFMLEDGDGLAPFYKQINAGKTVVRIDLKSDAGKERLEAMLERADVLLESFRPGVMERLGFGRERLQRINPRLVHCALSGFGQSGPYRLRAGHDLTYLAMTGALSVTGTAETPVMPFPPVADHAGAMQAAIAILGALLRRQSTGSGSFLDVSLFESALSWQSIGLTSARRPQAQLRRGQDLLTGGAACYQVYRTGDDRFVALAAIEEKFWRAFCEAVGRPEWIDRQLEPMPQAELIGALQALFASRSRAEWEALLAPVDCCFEAVLEYGEVAFHPHMQARKLVQPQGGDEPCTDVLFAAWIDGMPPAPRPPMRELSAAQVQGLWGIDNGCATPEPLQGGASCPAV